MSLRYKVTSFFLSKWYCNRHPMTTGWQNFQIVNLLTEYKFSFELNGEVKLVCDLWQNSECQPRMIFDPMTAGWNNSNFLEKDEKLDNNVTRIWVNVWENKEWNSWIQVYSWAWIDYSCRNGRYKLRSGNYTLKLQGSPWIWWLKSLTQFHNCSHKRWRDELIIAWFHEFGPDL